MKNILLINMKYVHIKKLGDSSIIKKDRDE